MKQTTIRIADIQTNEILYYDETYENVCFQFCNERNIDCLPSLESSTKVYIRVNTFAKGDKKFDVERIDVNRKINLHEHIFSPQLLDKFRDNDLLFVYDNSELVGVVHFSDYSKPIVMTYLYSQILSYERILRNYLHARGFQNSDMKNYFRRKQDEKKREKDKNYYKGKIDRYKREKVKVEKLPPFQSFDLTDLIGFLNDDDKDANKSSKLNHEGMRILRNTIMHARDLVNLEDWNAGNLIYDFKSFEGFFNGVVTLFADQKRIENRTVFLKFKNK